MSIKLSLIASFKVTLINGTVHKEDQLNPSQWKKESEPREPQRRTLSVPAIRCDVEPYNYVYTCYTRLFMYLSIIVMTILACPLANLNEFVGDNL